MNNQEMLRLIDSISRDRNVDKESLYKDIEQAMVSAARKHFNAMDTDNFEAEVDRITGHDRRLVVMGIVMGVAAWKPTREAAIMA